MSLFNSNGRLILLHRGMGKPKRAQRYDLLLSPEFYVIKKENIPIKYAFQAQRLAPSVLEDLLPEDRQFGYAVFKDGDEWFFVAYDPKEIEEFLKEELKIEPEQIGKIYFAQQIAGKISDTPLSLDELTALALVDGYVTVVPRRMMETNRYAKFSNSFRPEKSFRFSRLESEAPVTNEKQAWIAAGLITLLAIFFFIEGISYSKAAKKAYAQLNERFKDYPQLQSARVRKNILDKYHRIDKEQRNIRDRLEALSLLTSKQSQIDTMTLSPGKVEARISTDPKERKKIEKIASQYHLLIDKNVSKGAVVIRGAL